jgi:hypothetical protein
MAGPVPVIGTSGPDTLVVLTSSADTGAYKLNSDPQVAFSGPTSFTFAGLSGDDKFTLYNPLSGLFAPSGGITFFGGGDPGDALENLSGFADKGTFAITSSMSGTVTHTAPGPVTQTIAFSGVPLIADTVTQGSTDIAGSAGTETFTITDGGLVDGVSTFQIAGTNLPTLRLGNKSGVFGIDGGGGNDSVQINTTLPGWDNFGLKNVGAVTQTSPLTANAFALEAVAGPVTLSGSNNVHFLGANLTGAGSTFTFNTAGDLTLLAVISVAGSSSFVGSGISTSNGDITVSTENGGLGINGAVNAGSATARLTAGSTGSNDKLLEIVSFGTVAATGGVTLTGDNITITGSVNAGTAIATLQPFQAGTQIDLGGADGATSSA